MLNEHKSPQPELPGGPSNGQDAEERVRNDRKIPSIPQLAQHTILIV